MLAYDERELLMFAIMYFHLAPDQIPLGKFGRIDLIIWHSVAG